MIKKTDDLNSRSSALVKGTASLTLSVIIVKIIGFLYKIPLASILGDEGMGYFNSAYTVFTFFYMLCCGGIPKAISIIITENDTEGNYGASDKLLASCLKTFLLIGIFFCSVLVFFSRFIALAIGNERSYFSLLAIAPSLIFVSLTGVLRGYLNGRRRIGYIAISEMLDGCIKFIFGLLFASLAVSWGYAPEMIAAFVVTGIVIGSFASALFLYICAKNTKYRDISRQKKEDGADIRQTLKRIIRIALPITLSTAVMSASNLIDLAMIVRRLTASGLDPTLAISLYGNFTTLALPMLNLIGALITPVATSALPEFTALKTAGRHDQLSRLGCGIIKVCAWFVIPITFAFLFFSYEILCVFFNDGSAFLGAPLLTLLAPCAIFLPILTVANTALEASGHSEISLLSMTAGMIAKIILSYFLIGDPDIGIIGAPLGTTLCYAVALLISLFAVYKTLKLRLSFLSSLIKPSAFSLFSVGIGRLAYDKLCAGGFSLLVFMLCALFCVLIYLLLNCIFSKNEFLGALNSFTMHKKGAV